MLADPRHRPRLGLPSPSSSRTSSPPLMFKNRISRAARPGRCFLGALQETAHAVHRLRPHHLPARARLRRSRSSSPSSAPAASACSSWSSPTSATVVTLPVWYAYRAFSLEFLAQFGPECDVFPRPAAPVPAPPVPAV
ncbi:MAG: hypothetical protein M0C28_45470 [Candidatus Moduliflexus flocculans]|nr:hypothetical protein [Candidatus Moduliflexus flocculans]